MSIPRTTYDLKIAITNMHTEHTRFLVIGHFSSADAPRKFFKKLARKLVIHTDLRLSYSVQTHTNINTDTEGWLMRETADFIANNTNYTDSGTLLELHLLNPA